MESPQMESSSQLHPDTMSSATPLLEHSSTSTAQAAHRPSATAPVISTNHTTPQSSASLHPINNQRSGGTLNTTIRSEGPYRGGVTASVLAAGFGASFAVASAPASSSEDVQGGTEVFDPHALAAAADPSETSEAAPYQPPSYQPPSHASSPHIPSSSAPNVSSTSLDAFPNPGMHPAAESAAAGAAALIQGELPPSRSPPLAAGRTRYPPPAHAIPSPTPSSNPSGPSSPSASVPSTVPALPAGSSGVYGMSYPTASDAGSPAVPHVRQQSPQRAQHVQQPVAAAAPDDDLELDRSEDAWAARNLTPSLELPSRRAPLQPLEEAADAASHEWDGGIAAAALATAEGERDPNRIATPTYIGPPPLTAEMERHRAAQSQAPLSAQAANPPGHPAGLPLPVPPAPAASPPHAARQPPEPAPSALPRPGASDSMGVAASALAHGGGAAGAVESVAGDGSTAGVGTAAAAAGGTGTGSGTGTGTGAHLSSPYASMDQSSTAFDPPANHVRPAATAIGTAGDAPPPGPPATRDSTADVSDGYTSASESQTFPNIESRLSVTAPPATGTSPTANGDAVPPYVTAGAAPDAAALRPSSPTNISLDAPSDPASTRPGIGSGWFFPPNTGGVAHASAPGPGAPGPTTNGYDSSSSAVQPRVWEPGGGISKAPPAGAPPYSLGGHFAAAYGRGGHLPTINSVGASAQGSLQAEQPPLPVPQHSMHQHPSLAGPYGSLHYGDHPPGHPSAPASFRCSRMELWILAAALAVVLLLGVLLLVLLLALP
eukprot:jgi/Ulvmu1/9873/UM057_0028.1